ncbi:MAG: riboflavin synthase [Pseudomonadota bacterium]
MRGKKLIAGRASTTRMRRSRATAARSENGVFTGIIEHLGTVTARGGGASGQQLAVDLGPSAAGVKPGDSVAIDGACLTATSLDGSVAWFDAGPETLNRTSLGGLRVGDRVHVERALALGGRLDGHLVQGHVDCVGELRRVAPRGQAVDLELVVHDHPLDLVVEKGSIAVAGVSLTVNRVESHGFEVSVVPFTQQRTRLASLRPGQHLNIEFDVIGRYVARLVGSARGGHGLSMDVLRENGFA